MKLFIITLTLPLLILSSCAPVQKVDLEQELIRNYMPDSRETCKNNGRYGEYSYNLYDHGVELHALSAEIPVNYAEVWDTDHDGNLESVWILDHGKWRFWSKRKHSTLTNDSSPEFLTEFIGLANIICGLEKGFPKGIPPHQKEE